MNVLFIILSVLFIVWLVVSNIYVTKVMSREEMVKTFINGQCFVGKIFTNLFYAPAWFFKGLRIVVIATIK